MLERPANPNHAKDCPSEETLGRQTCGKGVVVDLLEEAVSRNVCMWDVGCRRRQSRS